MDDPHEAPRRKGNFYDVLPAEEAAAFRRQIDNFSASLEALKRSIALEESLESTRLEIESLPTIPEPS